MRYRKQHVFYTTQHLIISIMIIIQIMYMSGVQELEFILERNEKQLLNKYKLKPFQNLAKPQRMVHASWFFPFRFRPFNQNVLGT